MIKVTHGNGKMNMKGFLAVYHICLHFALRVGSDNQMCLEIQSTKLAKVRSKQLTINLEILI